MGSDAPLTAGGCSPRRARCPPTCGPSRCARRRACAPASRGGRVYTDDHAPVEWLVDESLVEYAAGE